MLVKIKDFHEYGVFYDDYTKNFKAQLDGAEMATALTQALLEEKLKKMRKENFGRIPIMRFGGRFTGGDGKMQFGEITSLNREEKFYWTVFGKERDKARFYNSGNWEKTDKNIAIGERVLALELRADELIGQAQALKETMEKPINEAYFKMEG